MTSPPPGFVPRSRYPRVFAKPAGKMTCNLCKVTTPTLTEDHVPPRSCLVERHVQIEPFEHALRSDRPELPISQSGLRYRTLCGSCNSLLGTRYDPALSTFCHAVRGRFTPAFLPTPGWTTWCQPGLVIRSLFGHLLAATTDDAETVPDTAMRTCVLDSSASLPRTLRVFYWLHLSSDVKVIRSVAMPARRGRFGDHGVFEIIKFLPFGFAVTDLPAYEGLPRLDTLARTPDAEVEVPFAVSLAAPADWPERVDEGNYLVGGRSLVDAVTARPRRRIRPADPSR